jgi:hypothetical protein
MNGIFTCIWGGHTHIRFDDQLINNFKQQKRKE